MLTIAVPFIDRLVGQPYHCWRSDLKECPMTVPSPDTPFSEKMAYYKTQHSSRGVKFTHILGGWLLQIAGHRFFEHNLPSTHKGWITYQLTGVIHVCEQYGELLARRSQRRAGG
jgi:hypothetical protein